MKVGPTQNPAIHTKFTLHFIKVGAKFEIAHTKDNKQFTSKGVVKYMIIVKLTSTDVSTGFLHLD